MECIIITVGEELLIGQVVDSNSAWIASNLTLLGINVKQIISIADDEDEIILNIGKAFDRTNLVIMTGGLGPTHDDVTKMALSRYFASPLVYHPDLYQRIVRLLQKFGRKPTPAHHQQAEIPQDAEILDNDLGTAPGMWMQKGQKILIAMPGVPYEMRHLVRERVLPLLSARLDLPVYLHRTILTVGEGESGIAQMLEPLESRLPNGFSLAFLPGMGQVRIRLSCRSNAHSEDAKRMQEIEKDIVRVLKPLVFGFDHTTLEKEIGILLREQKRTIATAESCTGGYLAHRFTAVPGSSDYFAGSVIAYDNRIKTDILGVDKADIMAEGAVSETVVRQMAEGVRHLFQTDFALSTSGIAGPGGGSPEKPVGTVWLACAAEDRTKTLKLELSKDRKRNIAYSTVVALNMLRKFLIGLQ